MVQHFESKENESFLVLKRKELNMHHIEIKNGHLKLDDLNLEGITEYSIKRLDNSHVELSVNLIAKTMEDTSESTQSPQI